MVDKLRLRSFEQSIVKPYNVTTWGLLNLSIRKEINCGIYSVFRMRCIGVSLSEDWLLSDSLICSIFLFQLLLTFDPIIVEKVAILLLNMMVVSVTWPKALIRKRASRSSHATHFLNFTGIGSDVEHYLLLRTGRSGHPFCDHRCTSLKFKSVVQ